MSRDLDFAFYSHHLFLRVSDPIPPSCPQCRLFKDQNIGTLSYYKFLVPLPIKATSSSHMLLPEIFVPNLWDITLVWAPKVLF